MSAFWIAGIVINVVALTALVVWAVRAWNQGHAARRDDRSDRGG